MTIMLQCCRACGTANYPARAVCRACRIANAMNGLDAMHDCRPGEAKMLISTALVDGSAVRVSVADSGTGVPPNKLNEIFDAFYTTKGQGTGLGLSIARTIVETYGGKIWAENRPGGGATFFFTMPLSKATA